jgi:hypothetical protein
VGLTPKKISALQQLLEPSAYRPSLVPPPRAHCRRLPRLSPRAAIVAGLPCPSSTSPTKTPSVCLLHHRAHNHGTSSPKSSQPHTRPRMKLRHWSPLAPTTWAQARAMPFSSSSPTTSSSSMPTCSSRASPRSVLLPTEIRAESDGRRPSQPRRHNGSVPKGCRFALHPAPAPLRRWCPTGRSRHRLLRPRPPSCSSHHSAAPPAEPRAGLRYTQWR